MFKYFSIILFLLCVFWAQAQKNSIQLEIHNAVPATGNMHVGVYNTAKGFPDVDKTYLHKIVPVTGETVFLSFEDVPDGKYCVSLFHDKNSNGVFDFNFLGMPLENYGFSKNIYHRFWAPTYEECSFELTSARKFDIKLVR